MYFDYTDMSDVYIKGRVKQAALSDLLPDLIVLQFFTASLFSYASGYASLIT